MFRRTTLRTFALATTPLAGCLGGGGGDGVSPTPTQPTDGSGMTLTTPAFEDGEMIPTEYTCDGADRSPRLDFDGGPDAVEQFALLMDDPDAPSADPFVHWVLYDLPDDTRTIPADVPAEEDVNTPDAKQGINGFGNIGYNGPCPPEGDGPHTYRIRLFGLTGPTGLDAGASRDELLNVVDGRTIARAQLDGEYERV